MFSIDTESGFKNAVFITGSYGLGENVVQGAVNPDEFYVFKPTLKEGFKPIIGKNLGNKKIKMIYSEGGDEKVKNIDTSNEERKKFCINNEEILKLAHWACIIEDHYSQKAGYFKPMDIEWAKDGDGTDVGTGELFIVQARPETVHSQKDISIARNFILKETCHAAIVSRELGIPCVIGSENATEKLTSGMEVTVSCAEGEKGRVYDGLLEFEIEEINLDKMPETKTKIMMNVGLPDKAFVEGQIPNDGVGLAREEFIINSYIGIHPLALIHYDELKEKAQNDEKIRQVIEKIDEATSAYENKVDFFIEQLARGISRIAAGFYPNDVIVRLSDFKSNEYANLIGGYLYEPRESNPMIGWRGASRYYDKGFKPAFGLECAALLKAREEMGLKNIKAMVPFCRTVEEGKKVVDTMREFGLVQGEDNLEVYVMCEIPSNVILADQFAEIFDGFSIGSNDLTQLALGLDRDSELVAEIYDERNDAVKRLIKQVIEVAKKRGRKIGICGQAPSDYEEFATFLVECGIDSISLNPDTVIKTKLKIAEKERELGIKPD